MIVDVLVVKRERMNILFVPKTSAFGNPLKNEMM
jgi:hypothetical protein